MLNNIFVITWSLPAILIAITVHEFAHGFAAYCNGDPTAKLAGRLTLNPLAHLDPIGTVMLLLFRVGWAKPVPINSNNLKNPKLDMVKISLAGPISNIIVALLFSMLLKMSNLILRNTLFHTFFWYRIIQGWFILLSTGIFVNISLSLFNLLPIPPLDGHHIVQNILPDPLVRQYNKIDSTYGMLILLFLFFSGIIKKILIPAVEFLYRILL